MPFASLLKRQQGYLDAADARYAMGWAYDPATPNTPVGVELLVDDAPAGTFAADRFRDDLRRAGKGNGRHGFEIPLPALPAREHRISVRVAGSSRNLRGSPKVVRGFSPPVSTTEEVLDVRGSLSVVVTTTDVGGALVEQNLRALLACRGQLEVDIVAVDCGSRDDTSRRLTVLGQESPQFRWVHNADPECRHDLVLHLSGEVRPATANLLAYHVRAHQGRGVVVRGRVDGGWPPPPGSTNNVSMRKGMEAAPVVDAPEAVVTLVRPHTFREAMQAHMLAGMSQPLALSPGTDHSVEDWLSAIEGVKAWAAVLDRHYRLGTQPWHGAYVEAVLELSYSHGRAIAAPAGDRASEYRAMLDRFQGRLASVASDEAVARLLKGVAV